MTVPVLMTVQRPIAMDVEDGCFAAPPSLVSAVDAEEEGGGLRRVRSPRSTTSAWITVRPPSVMLAVPEMLARRETLLPLSYGAKTSEKCWFGDDGCGIACGMMRWYLRFSTAEANMYETAGY